MRKFLICAAALMPAAGLVAPADAHDPPGVIFELWQWPSSHLPVLDADPVRVGRGPRRALDHRTGPQQPASRRLRLRQRRNLAGSRPGSQRSRRPVHLRLERRHRAHLPRLRPLRRLLEPPAGRHRARRRRRPLRRHLLEPRGTVGRRGPAPAQPPRPDLPLLLQRPRRRHRRAGLELALDDPGRLVPGASLFRRRLPVEQPRAGTGDTPGRSSSGTSGGTTSTGPTRKAASSTTSRKARSSAWPPATRTATSDCAAARRRGKSSRTGP